MERDNNHQEMFDTSTTATSPRLNQNNDPEINPPGYNPQPANGVIYQPERDMRDVEYQEGREFQRLPSDAPEVVANFDDLEMEEEEQLEEEEEQKEAEVEG